MALILYNSECSHFKQVSYFCPGSVTWKSVYNLVTWNSPRPEQNKPSVCVSSLLAEVKATNVWKLGDKQRLIDCLLPSSLFVCSCCLALVLSTTFHLLLDLTPAPFHLCAPLFQLLPQIQTENLWRVGGGRKPSFPLIQTNPPATVSEQICSAVCSVYSIHFY